MTYFLRFFPPLIKSITINNISGTKLEIEISEIREFRNSLLLRLIKSYHNEVHKMYAIPQRCLEIMLHS